MDSVFATEYPDFEVLLVDNASTDGSAEFATTKYGARSNFRVIQNERNFGYTQGNNIGIRHATGGYIALLNSDTRVERNWLTELVNAIRPYDVGAVQSKLLSMKTPDELDSAGGLIDYYGYHLERGRGEQSSMYTQMKEVFYAKGASVLLKREVLAKTGLFDPDIFMYFDEVDLCWRIRLSGYKILFVPASIVYHASGLTAAKSQEKERLYLHIKNHVLVLLKNYNFENMVRAAKVSVLFETRNMALFLARRKPLVCASILKALLWNLRHLKRTWKKRQTVQKLVRRVPDKEIKKQMLEPYPPFPLYLVFSRSRYLRKTQVKT